MPWEYIPQLLALHLIMADHATHAWDLTRAIGLTIDIQAAEADTALATSQASVSPEFRRRRPLRRRAAGPRGRVSRSIDSPPSAGRFALTTRPMPVPEHSPRENVPRLGAHPLIRRAPGHDREIIAPPDRQSPRSRYFADSNTDTAFQERQADGNLDGPRTQSERSEAMTRHGAHLDRQSEWDELRARYLAPQINVRNRRDAGVHHLALLAATWRGQIAFYQGMLEFPLTELFENRDYQGSTHFFFDIGEGQRVRVLRHARPRPRRVRRGARWTPPPCDLRRARRSGST